jgi:WD40 repeat protein
MNLDSQKSIFTGPLKSFHICNETKLICVISKRGLTSVLDLDFNVLASGNTEHAEKCVWNPSGSRFAIGLYSGTIAICETNENPGVIIQGNKKKHIDTKGITFKIIETCHTDLVSGVFWPSFETLVTTSFDHNVHQVDLEKASISSSILCPRSVQCSDFCSHMVFCGFENALVNAYDCRSSGKILSTSANDWVRALKVVGNAMSVGLENGQVLLYDLRAYKTPTHVLQAHEGKVMALDGDNEFLYTGGADGCIQRFTFT